MNIMVCTSDKQMKLLPAFGVLFNRHWGYSQDVHVVGFSEPKFSLPGNFHFYSAGKQENYPWNDWSSAVLKFLDEHQDWHHFILMLEDYFLVRDVDIEAIEYLEYYMENSPNVIRADLCADRLYAGGMYDLHSFGRLDIVGSDPESMYHMSLWTSMFNQEHFRKIVKPGMNPHEIEIDGTSELRKHSNLSVIGTRQYPLRHITACKHSLPNELNLEGLSERDKADVVRSIEGNPVGS